jgi:hypothetical protein
MSKSSTIHTHRTIMFAELEKVMDYSLEGNAYFEALSNNVTGKKSADGVKQTAKFLTKVYSFDISNNLFVAFKYFWTITDLSEKVLISFLYAVYQDYLLAESIEVVKSVQIGEKVTVESFENNVEKYYPNKYSKVTRYSIGKNIASSWKQAGFIMGKTKNIRTEPKITYRVACFAFLLAYLNGDRGDFIWSSLGVKTLCLPESKLRELAIECAKKDLMQYQYAGSVTAINFTNLLNKIGIHGNTN